MERLWSPWRHEYIANATSDKPNSECIFCEAQKNPADDAKHGVLVRGRLAFVILNRYPYISGHLMIAPNAHLAELYSASKEITDEMMDFVKRCEAALREVYRAEGFNVGMNLGRIAGAGIANHIHIHILPRWNGDTNFMTTVAETRVLPEDLETTYRKLRGKI